MDILGDIGGGKIGKLTQTQAVTWLLGKDAGGRKATQTIRDNMNSMVGRILSLGGSSASGGGNTRYTFQGATIYHESKGAGKTQGVTIIFVKRPDDVAKIVGLGYHVGAQSYGLTWTHHDWSALRNVGTISMD